jgi:hypothetical protein
MHWVLCCMEEAKLLWAQGQQSMAVRVARALLGCDKPPAPMDRLLRSRLQSLLGRWLSLNRRARTPPAAQRQCLLLQGRILPCAGQGSFQA